MPGQTLRLGWCVLRVVEGKLGSLTVLERALDGDEHEWVPGANKTLMETWYRREVCASVGLLEADGCPSCQPSTTGLQMPCH